MRSHVFLLLLVFYIPLLVNAEQAPPATAGTYAPDSLRVPTFTPPPPFVPKEPLPDAEVTIMCHDDKGETVTLQRGDASLAPDLPAPEPIPESVPVPQLEDQRPRVLNINMSGTVYNHQVTAVHWQHPAPVEPTVFWFKPHRNSRYLTPEDKALQEQAGQERAAQIQEGEAP